MAVCALVRLDIEDRISEYIPIEELPAPDGQGYLAVTFLKGNPIMIAIRNFFMNMVHFAGAGPGDANLLSSAAVKALKNCDVCLYDALVVFVFEALVAGETAANGCPADFYQVSFPAFFLQLAEHLLQKYFGVPS